MADVIRNNDRIILNLSIEEADAIRILAGWLSGEITDFSRTTDAISYELGLAVSPDYVWEFTSPRTLNPVISTTSFRKVNS